MPLKIVVFVGSVRSDRQGIKAARFVRRSLAARGHDITIVDPMELRLPLLDRMYKEYEKGKAPAALENLATLYRAADAFVVVSGEYNHSIQPALSNLLDHFLEEYFFRPSAIVCYSDGSFGGVRAAMQLRAMLGELGHAADLEPLSGFEDRERVCRRRRAARSVVGQAVREVRERARVVRERASRGTRERHTVLKAGLKACTTTSTSLLSTSYFSTFSLGTMCRTDFSFSLQMNSMIWVSRMMRWFTRTLNGAV